MALGTASALLLAGGTMSSGASIFGANQQAKSIKQQSEYNATIYDQQAEMIKQQKKIGDRQFLREAAQVRGAIVARTAGKGFQLSGSPLAILADTESEMLFDKAIADYNLQINQNYAQSAATNTRQQGAINARLTRFQGYTNAFSTLLNTGASLGTMNYRAGKL